MEFTLKEMVEGQNYVEFKRYHDGNLWYGVHKDDMDWHFPGMMMLEFPVPISDIGNATFLARDKAILFMRYIRKHLKEIEDARASQSR